MPRHVHYDSSTGPTSVHAANSSAAASLAMYDATIATAPSACHTADQYTPEDVGKRKERKKAKPPEKRKEKKEKSNKKRSLISSFVANSA